MKNFLLIILFFLLGFEGIITQAHGGNGVFSGKCIMRVSNFNILMKSHFDDISINQSYQVTAGTVIADRGPGIMINLDDVTEELDSLANVPVDSVIENPDDYISDLDSIIYDLDPIIVNDTIAEDLEDIADNLEELAGTDGLTDEQQQAIDDLLEQIENLLNNGNQSGDNKSFVMFKAHPLQTYGFDEPDSIASLRQYYQPPNIINNKEQLIRWKSVKANGGTDKVYARLDSINPNLKFYDDAGTELFPQDTESDTLKTLIITGGNPSLNGETTDHITAKIQVNDSTTKDVGILNIVSYQEQTKELVLVSVNGNTLPAGMSLAQFTDSLNKTYAQAIIKWNVEPDILNIDFDYDAADSTDSFNAWPESGIQYTPDMQALINKFMFEGNFDADKYYIFLLNNAESPVQLGIMPFFQNFAFIFTDKLGQAQNFAKTCEHELGHGAFGLLHQFKRHEGIDEFAAPNLMTYHPTSTKLNAYQWNLIQYPQQFLGVDYGAADDVGMIFECAANPPDFPGESEGEHRQTEGFMVPSEKVMTPCFQDWYYHISAEEAYETYDEKGQEITIEPEYNSGWYKAEKFIEINKNIIFYIGILNGDIHCLHYFRKGAEINVEKFFSEKPVSNDFFDAIKPAYSKICNYYTLHCSGSGLIVPTNTELDIILEFTSLGVARDIIYLFRINRLFKFASKKIFFNGIKLIDQGGEVLAKYSDNAFRELKFINEGGEIIGFSDDVIKYADESGNIIEERLVLVEKNGKLGFRKLAEAGDDLLNASGEFIDDVLEVDYLAYVTRKTNAGKTPRPRLEWKEVRDYWLNDSPLARGNTFNKKAVDNKWYPYNEVHLGNGKRLDSYKPPSNGNPGEIVSRKATNLDDIQLSTFESYLDEMLAKYSPGTPINSPKYSPYLDNQVLQGNMYLEIPASNQSISNIQDYINLANSKGITLRFKPE